LAKDEVKDGLFLFCEVAVYAVSSAISRVVGQARRYGIKGASNYG
jgi:hypothetical protein